MRKLEIFRFGLAALLTVVITACGQAPMDDGAAIAATGTGDGGARDGSGADGSVADGSVADGGAADGGAADGGARDSGGPDAGVPDFELLLPPAYSLRLTNEGMEVQYNTDGFDSTTRFRATREVLDELYADTTYMGGSHRYLGTIPEYGYPWSDIPEHRTALLMIQDRVVSGETYLAPILRDLHLATSIVAFLYSESDRDDERIRISGVVHELFTEPEPVDCTVFQARPWSATGGSIQLAAGPVTATADTAKVNGTSRCCADPPGVLTTSGGGEISANYLPGGGRDPVGAPKCKADYVDWYEGKGSVDAKAAHGAGCFADGAQDSATGARIKIMFGSITLLDATLASAQNDMTQKAESNVTLTSKACLTNNTVFADKAYTVERTATGRSEIE